MVTRLVAALAAIAALAYAGISVVMADQLTVGNHRPLGVSGSVVEATFENVSFPSRIDDLTLRGWLYRSPSASGRSAILVHGFHQNRVNADFGAVPLSKNLLAHGYDVLLFDLRSCGTSDGSRFTLGNLEPRDLLGAYDFMRSHHYAAGKMAVIGDSEGAATVIEAAKDLAPVGALVADSSFADLQPILQTQLPRNTSLPSIFYPGGELASEMFGLNPNLRPVDAVKALPSRAFLFIHGAVDTYIPVVNGMELKQASANAQSKLLIVPRAGHVKSFRTNPTLYLQTLYQFLDQQIAAHGG